jgi:dephospho-CoA kinase
MKWIGLTGGIASGKSTVSEYIRTLGFDVIDADVLAREAVKSGTLGHAAIIKEFGTDAISADGELNRRKIGEIVFADKSKLAKLEQIIHPEVRVLALKHRQRLEASGKTIAFYDVPLLFEKAMEPMFDSIVVVSCTADIQLQRLMKRNGFTEAEAKRRIDVQIPLAEKISKAHAVIENNGTETHLHKAVDSFLIKLK